MTIALHLLFSIRHCPKVFKRKMPEARINACLNEGLCVYAHLTKDHQAYVIVNNRSEGNAPLMIQGTSTLTMLFQVIMCPDA
jgi:hypothetical protein